MMGYIPIFLLVVVDILLMVFSFWLMSRYFSRLPGIMAPGIIINIIGMILIISDPVAAYVLFSMTSLAYSWIYFIISEMGKCQEVHEYWAEKLEGIIENAPPYMRSRLRDHVLGCFTKHDESND